MFVIPRISIRFPRKYCSFNSRHTEGAFPVFCVLDLGKICPRFVWRELNREQRKVLLYALHRMKIDQLFNFFFSGRAGVGKSNLIKMIYHAVNFKFNRQPGNVGNTQCQHPGQGTGPPYAQGYRQADSESHQHQLRDDKKTLATKASQSDYLTARQGPGTAVGAQTRVFHVW